MPPSPNLESTEMKVYYSGGFRDHQAFVTPARDPIGIKGGVDSSWLEDDGETPKMLVVNFRGGIAEVPDALGKYLVASGMAKRSGLGLKHPPQPAFL